MKRTASAHWEGDLMAGKGSLTTQSTTLNKTQYSFKTRFEDGVGTNPEELLAAAHAGCFTMAMSMLLGQAGFTATAMDTTATITISGAGADMAISASHLAITASIPNIEEAKFQEIVKVAEQHCLVSKALSIAITSEAKLT
jgi:osmotically inducible protein OsmC